MPTDDSQIYLDIRFKIKNISSSAKKLENIFTNYKAIYNSKYNYSTAAGYYSDSSDINPIYSWDTIEALGETTLHLAMLFPREINDTDYPIEVEFYLDGKKQLLEFR